MITPAETMPALDLRFWLSTLGYCGGVWLILGPWIWLDARKTRPERLNATRATGDALREDELADRDHQHVDVGV